MNGRDKGFALLSVLWTVGLMSAIAAVLIRAAHGDMQRAQVDMALAQAQAEADGAARLAILHALGSDGSDIWDGTAKHQGQSTVAVQDQAGLVDINHAPLVLLAGLLRQAAGAADQGPQLAAAIVAARGTETVATPFYSTLDLLRVPGITPGMIHALSPLITVYSSLDGIDPKVAPAPVGAALPGQNAQALVVTSPRDAIRVSTLSVYNGITAWRTADVRLSHGPKPYRIMTWMSDAPR